MTDQQAPKLEILYKEGNYDLIEVATLSSVQAREVWFKSLINELQEELGHFTEIMLTMRKDIKEKKARIKELEDMITKNTGVDKWNFIKGRR